MRKKVDLLKRLNLVNLDVFNLLLSLQRILAKSKIFVHLINIIMIIMMVMMIIILKMVTIMLHFTLTLITPPPFSAL